MKFQTLVPVKKEDPQIDYHARMVLMGSCFVEHIGEKLEYYQFQQMTNPFGVLFNPMAITGLLERAVNQRWFTKNDLFFSNGRWHSYELHSVCSHADADHILETVNNNMLRLYGELQNASHFILTLGTSWVYRHLDTNRVVANCHKQPQRLFEKELLDIHEIELQLEKTDHLIKSINPDCAVITTVSPVRHIKDGIVANQRSKAHLIAALHQFLETVDTWSYFPSYEILMDELRDYRFYTDDMLHPSPMAVEVVWSRFLEAWVAPGTHSVMEKADRIRKGLKHKPFDPEGEAHLKFVKKIKQQIKELVTQYPHMKFDDEFFGS
ncbi:GSCFA domain-containing protein [Robertkochia marina]|uniref:GSCFA domain-containing protein n=1 Tax=Robertkochia marina TaxID=1227945 RepID=A0A4S3M282_9FLAO|nr:GSCFA domain-containing protein [Robertkochia marina]THD68769.1 GSCFA domain-containing protein [Robertkochia marina]TRZ43840.1 GSCFA domain-containing protein [Robertkochia marina]